MGSYRAAVHPPTHSPNRAVLVFASEWTSPEDSEDVSMCFIVLLVVLIVFLTCLAGWIHGEAKDKRGIRVASTIALMIVLSAIAATVSGILTGLKAIHEYLDAASAQLTAGNIDFVIEEFDGFKTRAGVTYETGAFEDSVRRETIRMKAGPQLDKQD
jgi:hypothetical protein